MVHFTAAVDLASSVQEEDLERALWPSSGGQDNSQERMKWMRWGRKMTAVSFFPRTWSGGDESCSASLRGLWEGEKEGQVSVAGFFTRADEKAWQYKSSQKASQCVSASCPAGISFTALQRVHSQVNLIRTVRLVKK